MPKDSTQKPVLAGVIGHPVSHSLSPLIHTIWAKRAEIDGFYIPFDVPPTYDDFARAMDGLRAVGFAGVNVTLPHKDNALRYADTASENASRAGAANMLTFSDQGAAAGNSDISGFADAVRKQSSAPGKSALVLGAGGAARGVVLALKSLGVPEIMISNRTLQKAGKLAADFGLVVIDWQERTQSIEKIDILVNTTSLGMGGQPGLDMSLAGLKQSAMVADIVYSPLQTPLLKEAAAAKHKTINGLAMLMHQAAPGFRQWFGGEAVVDDSLHTDLVKELKRQGRA
ncbi:shikimate dehydrogenase [Hyphococcus sp.]|uniref:shikimate dehydrogenase n=1 Tax=Hyphococcus sp. TaxID=2038636 RepID=UPI00207DC440|nr:MAG: shikimate dehydrogenase (NADP(+)) [Marinicaulis sp.]